MIPSVRQQYNQTFTVAKYGALQAALTAETGITPPFRVAETPVFLPASLWQQLTDAGEAIIGLLLQPDFLELTASAIPRGRSVPGESAHSSFVIIDFAITRTEHGSLAPQLIELQGFPSLFAFQELLARQYRAAFDIPADLRQFPAGLDTGTYTALLQRTILNGHPPESVILLEIMPQQQKTLIDFTATEKMLGIRTVCVTELIPEGRKLYYEKDGRKIRIRRIYNRMIFEELEKHSEVADLADIFRHELDVEWAPHPNWYYRISKYLLPLIHGPFAPRSWFLHEIPVLPQDLENYVLKPLFSFAGQGVIIDPAQSDIDAIEDPENWILQQKVQYAPVIETPTGPAKCEVRLMYCWPDDAPLPILAFNLARISKGKMIGVGYNADQEWVGGSCCFYEG